MTLSARTLSLLPGDGVVVRGARTLVWAAHTDRTSAVLGQIVDAAEQAGAAEGAPGRRLLRRLAGVVSAADPDDVPAFAAVADTDDGLAVMVVGDVDVHVLGPGGESEVLRGRDAATWVDRIVDAKTRSLAIVPTGTAPPAPDPWSDLREGTARAGGAVLALPGGAAVPSEPAPVLSVVPDLVVAEPVQQQPISLPPDLDVPTSHVPEPAAGSAPDPVPPPPPVEVPAGRATEGIDFTSVSLLDVEPEPAEPLPVAGEGAEPQDDGVLVDGIWCSRKHFNDPQAAYCSVCGISMVHQTHNLVKGPRPPLGVLVLDDGSTFGVDGDYVLGREPIGDPAVASGEVLPLVVDDPGRSVSRVHARLTLQGWEVRLADAGSANGTYVARPGSDQWERLAPDEPHTLAPGSRIRLGQRELAFDSHHRA